MAKSASEWNIDCLVNVLLIGALLLVLPVLFIILIMLQVHRQIVTALLALQNGASFRGLLEGTDVVWAVQEHSSKAMSNVLLLFDMSTAANPSNEIIRVFRERFTNRLHSNVYEKLFWHRRLRWGYYFWTLRNDISMQNYVHQLDTVPFVNTLSRMQLCQLIGPISSRECREGTSWELLIGTQPVIYQSNATPLYPVVFRYHHSIADGVAIFRLFHDDFLDDAKAVHAWDPEHANQIFAKPSVSWNQLKQIALTGPKFIINELFFKRERNPFYGQHPSGNKLTCWLREEPNRKGAPNLICTIKKVKRLLEGSSFTDVFLTALAMSLRAHCARKMLDIPPSLTIGTMRRFGQESKGVRLCNRSSAVFQTLPIGCLPVSGSPMSIPSLVEQINSVAAQSAIVQSSTDPLTTHWSVSYLPMLLPVPIMRFLFTKSKFSVAFSNLPAFQTTASVGSYVLQDACFWVPNIEGNLLGVTVLTTAGRLQISMIADRIIISNEEELDAILHELVRELENFAKLFDQTRE
ncbi:uncharacterized protein LOC131206402 [Anopheles bellator]|uniref:uncharacterized protein LOC131206402 n=1 Tax=Anopheles bellator TaxID=139047 RepID=UPI002647D6AB|nr:uncharacterized protein LOC131206402 [Anopheles bellator]